MPLGEHILVAPRVGVGVAWLHNNERPGIVDDGGLRAEAAITAFIPVRRRFSLSFGLSAELSPLAFARDQSQAPEPWGYLRAGLGLSWGEQ